MIASMEESYNHTKTSVSTWTSHVILLYHLNLTLLASVNVSSDYMDYIKNVILPPVENFWEATLKVVPVSGNLTGQKQKTMCSGTITVPDLYNTTGVPADLVLFVDTVNDTAQDFVAFAGPCILSQKNYR